MVAFEHKFFGLDHGIIIARAEKGGEFLDFVFLKASLYDGAR